MDNEKNQGGLEALAGDMPLPPAKASTPVFIFHSLFSVSKNWTRDFRRW